MSAPSILLERAAPLATLVDLVDRIAAPAGGAAGRCVLLRGEAGIGKTSLLEALRESRAEAVRWWWGRCSAWLAPAPLGPLRGLAATLPPALATVLGDAVAPQRVLPVLLELLRERTRPTVLVIEDAHWADGATLDLLRYLGRRIDATASLLIVSYRDDALGEAHPLSRLLGGLPADCTTRLQLRPLSRAGVEDWARRAGHDPREAWRLSAGNPFLPQRAVARRRWPACRTARGGAGARRRAAGARKGAARIGQRRARPARPGPAGHAAARCRGLSAELCRRGPAAGRRRRCGLPPWPGAAGAGRGAARSASARTSCPRIRRPRRQRGLRRAPGPPCRTRRALGRGLPLGAARRGRGGAGGCPLAGRPVARPAAQPCRAGAAVGPCRVDRSAVTGLPAEQCPRRGHRAAADRAAASPGPRRCRRTGPRPDLARPPALVAQRRPAAGPAVGRARGRGAGRPAACVELARAHVTRSHLHLVDDDFAAALHWGRLALAAVGEGGDPAIRSQALNNVGTALARSGDAAGGCRLLADSLAVAQAHALHEDVVRAHLNLFIVQACERRLAAALDSADRGVAESEQQGLDLWTVRLRVRRAWVRMMAGRWQDADTDLRLVRERHTPSPMEAATAAYVAAVLAVRRGETGARRRLVRAVDAMRAHRVRAVVRSDAAGAGGGCLPGRRCRGCGGSAGRTHRGTGAGGRSVGRR